MKRMLINATQQEELRVALVDGQRLYDLDIESPGHEQKKANIYKGTITKINPSLEAAFVSYGGERDGFLSLKEIADSYFPSNISGRRSIKHLKEGQEVLVQIEKEIRGKKGAALTTYISLAGSYLVLMPNDPRAGGVSRRIEGEDRADLKRIIDALDKPRGMGVIARTAGVGKTQEELQQDLDALLSYWEAIQTEAKNHPAPSLIHKESDIITRAFRDYLRDDVGEILIDNQKVLETAKKRLVGLGRTEYLSRIKLYTGEVPLFNHFQIESQIESAFQREVRLPSGGSIVIDTTEALTAIDINSAKSIRGSDIEETAFTTNLEAAEEIARQLRLRDLGGLIVIDFIDMTPIRNQREVENRLKEAMKNDRARIQTTRISRFGLLEMSRQRLSPSLREATHHICPRCSGTGTIRDNNSLSLSILRLINEEALKDNTSQVDVIVPVPIASYLLNEKRRAIAKIEQQHPGVKIVIAADEEMETPQYKVIRKRKGEECDVLSYALPKLVREQEEEEEELTPEVVKEEAILSGVTVKINEQKPAKKAAAGKKSAGLISGLLAKIKQLFSSEEEPKKPAPRKRNNRNDNNQERKRNNSPRKRNNNSSDETKPNNRRSRNTKANAEPAKAKETAVVEERAAESKPQERKAPKPRRNQRQLAKSVRVAPEVKDEANSAVAAATEVTAQPTQAKPDAAVTALTPETMPEKVAHTEATENNSSEAEPRRTVRRTPRHLRMNGQRRKRQRELNQGASPVPLSMAVVSPELASGKVVIDYTLLRQKDLEATMEAKPLEATAPETQADTAIAPSVTIHADSEQTTVSVTEQPAAAALEQSTATESVTIVENSDAEVVVEQSTVSLTELFAVQPTTEPVAPPAAHAPQTGHAFAEMTKAVTPVADASQPTEFRNNQTGENIEPAYQFHGKGTAGAHSAEHHAYAEATKPQAES